MVTATTLIDAERAATFTDTGRVVLVEPGVWHNAGCELDDRNHTCPPVEWAALTGKCTTCRGKGTLKRLSAYRSGTLTRLDSTTVDCSSCGGTGHPLVTVVTACPCDRVNYREGTPGGWDCPDCDGNEFGSDGITVGTATAEAVQIVADSEDVGSAYWGPACIEAHVNGARYYPAWDGALEYDDGYDLDLGPDPVQHIGSWALILTRKGES